jgi:hypothetical protein
VYLDAAAGGDLAQEFQPGSTRDIARPLWQLAQHGVEQTKLRNGGQDRSPWKMTVQAWIAGIQLAGARGLEAVR